MNENGKHRAIRAGKAFMAAIENDPQAKRALQKTLLQLRTFAQAIKATGPTPGEVIRILGRAFATFDRSVKNLIAEDQQSIQAELDELRAEQERLFEELATEITQSLEAANADLESYGFDPPGGELEAWAELARIVEQDPEPATFGETYDWAVAWAKREILRHKLARGETPIQAGDGEDGNGGHPKTTSAENASIRRDEHDPRVAWCMGKRIYLGNNTQVSRLFWLLASPVGRARSLWEVQRAVDSFETDHNSDATGDEFKRASQRVRKAMTKLRAALRENKADDHLLIVRGGDNDNREYTMVLRFSEKP